jgi:hypothetical protein
LREFSMDCGGNWENDDVWSVHGIIVWM